MPARVSIELNEETLAMVVAELELSEPPSFTLNHNGKYFHPDVGKKDIVRGMYYSATNHVDITANTEQHQREGLFVLTKHIRFTVLHELRHAWQREHWTDEQKRLGKLGRYETRPEEVDANGWAEYASPKYKSLVQIKRQQIGNRRRLPG